MKYFVKVLVTCCAVLSAVCSILSLLHVPLIRTDHQQRTVGSVGHDAVPGTETAQQPEAEPGQLHRAH